MNALIEKNRGRAKSDIKELLQGYQTMDNSQVLHALEQAF